MLLRTCNRDGLGKAALKLERIIVIQVEGAARSSSTLLFRRSSHSDDWHATTLGELRCPLLVSGQGPLHGGVVARDPFHLDCEITLPGTSPLSRCLAFPIHWQHDFRVRQRREKQLPALLCCEELELGNKDVCLHQTCRVHLVPLEIIGLCADGFNHHEGVTRAIDHR